MVYEINSEREEYDYIVVGSGPGGGPLAANLARHGHRVLLLEAGDDQGDSLYAKVPAVFPIFEEDPMQRWDFFVKHYSDEAQAAKDSKMCWKTPDGAFFVGTNPPEGSTQLGIWYPRSGTLGGCATHNGLANILPPDSEWENIAHITGDETWRPNEIRRLFQRLERCWYLPEGTPGHGFDGWLQSNHADVSTFEAATPFSDGALLATGGTEVIKDFNGLNPSSVDGVYRPVIAMSKFGRRSGTRDYLVATATAKNARGAKKYPLQIYTHSFATRILFEEGWNHSKPRAIGVEFLEGKSMYRADPRFNKLNSGIKKRVFASKEVIVACGVFNTPQLLKLSGIGPRNELASLDIDVLVDLPGVGENLQDNYEFGMVAEANQILSPLKDGTFLRAGDPLLEEWLTSGGRYATNLTSTLVLQSSSVARADPDLAIYGLPAPFTGYFPGVSVALNTLNNFTWEILKIRPGNSGKVTLRSKDPQELPDINFDYFNEGEQDDLQAMFEGVTLIRKMFKNVSLPSGPLTEVTPGEAVQTEEQIKESVKNESFGHHATSTCAIGSVYNKMACLDSRFRVRGVEGLRVVDASAFPRVPGSFPALATAILSEKATDVILEDAFGTRDDRVLDGVAELTVLEEDARLNEIVFQQAQASNTQNDWHLKSNGTNGVNGLNSKRRAFSAA